MNEYLFRISLTASDSWSKFWGQKVKPIYYVCRDKEAARKWGEDNMKNGLKITQVTKLAIQVGGNCFSGNFK